MNIYEALEYAKEHKMDSFDARALLSHFINKNESFIITHTNDFKLSSNEEILFTDACREIESGKPLQYITNYQYFYGYKFYVDENVLIPQPDTEVLVASAIEAIKKMLKKKSDDGEISVLDMCTGSGAIAISIKKQFEDVKNLKVMASDISKKALEVAKRNAKEILKNENSIGWLNNDLFDGITEKFDLIVSNPPYIRTADLEKLPDDVKHEPIIALDGGKDGLDMYRRIRAQVPNNMKENSILMMEIGYDQKEDVMSLFESSKCLKDFAQNDRVIIWEK